MSHPSGATSTTATAKTRVASYRMFPESPRWLLLQNRHEDALDILVKIASYNHRKIPPRSVLSIALTHIGNQIQEEQKQHKCDELDTKFTRRTGKTLGKVLGTVLAPYSTVLLACRMFRLFVAWLSVSTSYYGISLNATNISADPYLYIFLGGVSEVPAYLVMWPMLTHTGRRPSLAGLFFTCAACIATNSLLMLFFPSVLVWVKIIMSLIGKMAAAAAFHHLYIYTAELFTTQQRSLAVGHCSFIARIGSSAAPYINDLLGDIVSWGPSAVFAIMALLSSFVPIFLPETWHKNLPENDAPHDQAEDDDSIDANHIKHNTDNVSTVISKNESVQMSPLSSIII